ncbi:MAG: hypothetical protein K2X94_03920 [Amoebophilaceae bacterium]|nr:hypothetical protein [Amoebophilaceae bacterium]
MKFLVQKQTYIYMGLASLLSAHVDMCKYSPVSTKPIYEEIKGANLSNCKQEASFKFEAAIEDMLKAADQKRGITWMLDKKGNLLRDATHSTGKVYASQDYVVQILSICRAATRMCELYHKEEKLVKPFEKIANFFIKQHQNKPEYAARDEKAWVKEVKGINRTIVDLLHKIFPEKSQDDLNNELRIIENYAGLEDTHYDITTTVKIEGEKFDIEDKKWLKLTTEQQEEFTNRQAKFWYKNLTDLERRLVDRYEKELTDNNHYIPTQIRNLPGCRNAYKKSIWAYDQEKRKVRLGRYGHTATLSAFKTHPADSDKICKQNWDQLCKHASTKRALNFICLNHNQCSGPFGLSAEKKIVEQTKKVVNDADANNFIGLPINYAGTFSEAVFTPQFLNLYKECRPILKDTDPKQSFFEEKLLELKEMADCTPGLSRIKYTISRENLYAEAGANYIACRSFLNSQHDDDGITEVVSCKSGKDRTGFVSLLSDAKLIEAYLRANAMGDKATEKAIKKALAGSGHVQLLAALNGGMAGKFGLKGYMNRQNTDNDVNDLLFCKSALLTSIPR